MGRWGSRRWCEVLRGMKPGIGAAGRRAERGVWEEGCCWDDNGKVGYGAPEGPLGGWEGPDPFVSEMFLGMWRKLHLVPKRQFPFWKYLQSCELFSGLEEPFLAVCVYAERSSQPTRSWSKKLLDSTGERSPKAESLMLNESSRLHDSLRGVGVPEVSIGFCTAASAFCLGAVDGPPFGLGTVTGSSDHLKTVGNCVTFKLNWWNSEFHPAPWTSVILSRTPLKGTS